MAVASRERDKEMDDAERWMGERGGLQRRSHHVRRSVSRLRG
jgi:hypothetical protein